MENTRGKLHNMKLLTENLRAPGFNVSGIPIGMLLYYFKTLALRTLLFNWCYCLPRGQVLTRRVRYRIKKNLHYQVCEKKIPCMRLFLTAFCKLRLLPFSVSAPPTLKNYLGR